MRLFSAILLAFVTLSSLAAPAKIPVKVVVVTMFEIGNDTGDVPGEFQHWYDGEHLTRRFPMPAANHDAMMNDDEIDNLIFMPGFSTADAVSNISGRGVGMDVVRRSILALGGRISIASKPGVGSTFTLSLPLTLAVLDGMVVGIHGQTLVVPITTIIETLQPRQADIHHLGDGARVIAIRGSFVPLIDVGTELCFSDALATAQDSVALMVEGEDGSRAALLVGSIHGQRQVVIKSLEANYRHVPGVAAATILGDGRVALILDVDALVASSRNVTALTQPQPWNAPEATYA